MQHTPQSQDSSVPIVSKANRLAALISDWWTLVAGVGGSILAAAYTQMSALFPQAGWIDAICFGVVLGLYVTVLTMLIQALYRQKNKPQIPIRDRRVFRDEVVNVSDLMDGSEEVVFRKQFIRCIITGSGNVRLGRVHLVYSSTEMTRIVTPAQGQTFQGNALFEMCDFEKCYFDIPIVLSTGKSNPNYLDMKDEAIGEWKARRWSA